MTFATPTLLPWPLALVGSKKTCKKWNPSQLWKESVWLVSVVLLSDWRGNVLSGILSWVGTRPGLAEGTEVISVLREEFSEL